MKVLIVDDSYLIRRAIREHLSDEFSIDTFITAENGKTALEIFTEERPDAVTLNLTMPEMDGMACLKAIMKIDKTARVMIVSAAEEEAAGEALGLGAKLFVKKPFTSNELVRAFKVLLKHDHNDF